MLLPLIHHLWTTSGLLRFLTFLRQTDYWQLQQPDCSSTILYQRNIFEEGGYIGQELLVKISKKRNFSSRNLLSIHLCSLQHFIVATKFICYMVYIMLFYFVTWFTLCCSIILCFSLSRTTSCYCKRFILLWSAPAYSQLPIFTILYIELEVFTLSIM